MRGLFLLNSFSLKKFSYNVIRSAEKPSNENVSVGGLCRQQKYFMKVCSMKTLYFPFSSCDPNSLIY